MLVLSRRIGEELVIDGEIRVMIVGVKGSTVRIGVAAPPVVHVVRSELVGKPRPDAVTAGATEPASSNAGMQGPRPTFNRRPRKLHHLTDYRTAGG